MRFSRSLFSLLSVLLWLSVSRPAGGQTWSEGDLQINRKRATAGFDASELTFGSGLNVAYDGTSKTVTVTASGTGLGTVTSFAFTNSTGITGTVTNATTTPTLSLALTSAAVGLGNVENTALSTWTGSSSLTTLGTISTGTWQGSAIGDSYISSAATWNGKLNASAVSTFGLTLIDDADAAAARTTLGLGTLATQNGTITDYLTTATAATTYQPLDAQLTDVAGLAPTKGRLIVGDGTNWVDLGVGTNGHVLTADSVEAKGVKWAAATGGIGGTVGAVNYGIPVADGTGGSTLQASPATLDDAGTLRTVGSFISEQAIIIPNAAYSGIFGTGGMVWSWADGDSNLYTGSIVVPLTADGNWTWTLPQKSGTFAMLSDITGGVTDGDKGDIVVSSSGTVWSIDSGVITTAARTVLDDATVGDMVNTLGGATSTGTGGLVRASSPTLTTPNLGTPSAVTLTNATGLPLSTGVTGILPIANIATGTPDGTKFVRDDGTLAVPAGGSGDMVLLASATASSSANITFDNVFDSSIYSEYEIRCQGVQPATNSVSILVQLRNSTPADITSTHKNNNSIVRIDAVGNANNPNLGGTTGWLLSGALGNSDTNKRLALKITISPFAGEWTAMNFFGWVNLTGTNGQFLVSGAGQCEGTTAPAGVKIYMSSGNIGSGTFYLYGIKK